jgi:hypothetical protein
VRREATAAEIASAFQTQAEQCRSLGSPLYGTLLEAAARDVAGGGVLAHLVQGWRGHPVLDALALRLLGGVHRLVLEGAAPALARHFPSAGGAPELERVWGDFLVTAEIHAARLRAALDEPVQTNEIARSAVLLGGFLRVAAETGLPLRALEIGSSAGLNLLFDRHRYVLGPHAWGDPGAEITIRAAWEGPPPDLAAPLRVTSRAGSDPNPLDLRDDAVVRRLASFLWPEQSERRALLDAAVQLARREGVPVGRASAAPFLARELAATHPGVATVVFHSVIWWYVPEDERREVTRLVLGAGARATAAAPLYWLRMEGATPREAELRLLRVGPPLAAAAPQDLLLAKAHWHGQSVRWLVEPLLAR